MATTQSSPPERPGFDPHTGTLVPIVSGLARLTAPNASPFTFTGTNTFLIGHDRVAVLDPGPDDDAHLEAILAAAGNRPIEAIFSPTPISIIALVPRLKQRTGAPLVLRRAAQLSRPLKLLERNPFAHAADYALAPDREIKDGDRLEYGG